MVEDFFSIATIIGIAVAAGGAIFALGKLFERVNQLKERLDKLESAKSDEKKLTPLEILDEKYANGDVTTEEYQEKKKNLQGS